jgi:hypothetical protein
MKKNVKNEPQVEQAMIKTPAMNSTLVSIAKDSNGDWHLVTMKYDLQSRSFGPMETLNLNTKHREDAIERFKVAALDLEVIG